MWFIGVEVEQETSAPPPKKNPGSAPVIMPLRPLSLDVSKRMEPAPGPFIFSYVYSGDTGAESCYNH